MVDLWHTERIGIMTDSIPLTAQELALKLDTLAPIITPTKWEVVEGLYSLAIKSQKGFIEDAKFKFRKPVRNVCVLATVGIKKSDQKRANAELIVLLKNNLGIIRDALKHSSRAGHGK